MHIFPQTVQEVIRRLKHGKFDEDTLVLDHIIEAPTAIGHLLAHLFTAILRHGFMSSPIRDAIIQPIPKGSKDPSSSANYQGIALASSLTKVLEWSLLLSWNQYFATNYLQLGFEAGFSTTLCIYWHFGSCC